MDTAAAPKRGLTDVQMSASLGTLVFMMALMDPAQGRAWLRLFIGIGKLSCLILVLMILDAKPIPPPNGSHAHWYHWFFYYAGYSEASWFMIIKCVGAWYLMQRLSMVEDSLSSRRMEGEDMDEKRRATNRSYSRITTALAVIGILLFLYQSSCWALDQWFPRESIAIGTMASSVPTSTAGLK